MPNIIYEQHRMNNPALPIIFHTDTVRTIHTAYTNWHDNTEFLYCIEGSGRVSCDDSILGMNVADTIVINARRLHKITSEEGVRYRCLILDNSFFEENGISLQNLWFSEKISDSHAGMLMERIAQCINEENCEFHIAKTRLCLLEYIYYIASNFSRRLPSSNLSATKSYLAVLNAIEYINNNFTQKLSLDEISARVGFSKYHFSRIFKENTGVTVLEHINARRCNSAAFLLRETKTPISEIGFECGFDSPSYFAKAFFAFYGMLPSDYRRSYSKL